MEFQFNFGEYADLHNQNKKDGAFLSNSQSENFQLSSIFSQFDTGSSCEIQESILKNIGDTINYYSMDYNFQSSRQLSNIEYQRYESNSNYKVTNKKNNTANYRLGINGRIDNPVIQSTNKTSDCWLIAGINSLNATPKGQQIIKNSIVANQDGSVTVNFAGVSRSVTISADEMAEHDTDMDLNDEYSNGDNDMLVIELAMEKLITSCPQLFPNEDDGLNGGFSEDIWKALTPNYKINIIKSEGGDISNQIYNTLTDALYNDNLAIEFSLDGGNHARLTNGKKFEYNGERHALAITNVQENRVTFNNSQNGNSYTMSWDEFIKLAPCAIRTIDLTNA